MKHPPDRSEKILFRWLRAPAALGLILAFATAAGLARFSVSTAHAQSPAPVIVPIALAPLQHDTPLELVALTLDADISESNGHTFVAGNSTFKIHNTDRLNDLQVPVGFPSWAGDPYAFDPTRLGSFSVSVDGQRIRTLNPSRADLKIGGVVRTVDWYTFTLSIAGDEKKTVRFDFTQDLGDSALPRFVYGLVPAADWKNSIGSARITLNLPAMTTLDQIVATDPPNPTFNGTSVTWLFTNHEPPINPSLTIIRPTLWNDLNSKRRAVQQSPNDANAHAALGGLLRQFAQIDSPRSDSFYAQAVAELETAVRLDPNQRAARQALAALYESRAGPATGPRQPAYVALAAAQWQALASSDANARKQLAEDEFYLGLDAQTRRAFADAAKFYDQAQSLAPGGAGPLYTPEHLAAQRRALNIAWALDLIDQNDAVSARAKALAALGAPLMASFDPPPFYVTRAQVSMSSTSRTMTFALAPFAASPAELQNTLSGAAAALIAAGAHVSFDDASLAIAISFADHAELTDELAALAKVLPPGAEWSLVRAVLSPHDVLWNETDGLVTHVTDYREEVDLAAACSAFGAESAAAAKNLAPLDSAPGTSRDDEAQLKRALLKYAQSGWQAALAQGSVTYRAGSNETRVEPCAVRTVALSASAFRPLRVALIVAAIEIVGIGILVVRWQRRKR